MFDGPIARQTNSASKLGERLDSVADLMFVVACFTKLLPKLDCPLWVWYWIIIIACIKIINLLIGSRRKNKTVFLHTSANRITGLLLFLFPLTFSIIDLSITSAILGVVATYAAVNEMYLLTKKDMDTR